MVKIRIIVLIFLISFSNHVHSAQKFHLVRDAEIEYFLYKLIKSTSDENKKKIFHPRLILNHNYNAFVTGTNKIYINTGLINKSNSFSEIQAILAHEIGHLVLNHHSTRLINARNTSNYAKFATLAGLALSTNNKLDANSAIGLLIGSNDLAKKSSLQFSRIQEQQADRFALDQMIKKNISLKGLEILLTNLSNEELFKKNTSSNYYRSHPFSKQRLEQLKRYKLKYQNTPVVEKQVLINENKISLRYIKTKIKAYSMDPFKTLKMEGNKNDFLVNYLKLIALYRVGKYDLANKKLETIKNNYKNYPFFYELQGDINYKKGEFKNAIKGYKKAIQIFPEVFTPSTDLIKVSLVKTYLQTNDKNNLGISINLLEELLINNPNWSYLWRLLAKSSGKLNNKGISYIALAEEALIKKNFIKAEKYVGLANKQADLPLSYKLRGSDILARIKINK